VLLADVLGVLRVGLLDVDRVVALVVPVRVGGGITALSSAIAKVGRNLTNSRNSVVKMPIDPTKMPMSVSVGKNMCHSPGRKARCRLVTMITNRSNHMPMVTNSATTQITIGFWRSLRNQKTCGLITLQKIIAQ
jgi:hypothetical protein